MTIIDAVAGGAASPNSTAPTSSGSVRATPRWSMVSAVEPASMAGLPAMSAAVSVGPPLSASAPSIGSVPSWSEATAAKVSASGVVPITFHPADVCRPFRLAPLVALLSATMVFVSVTYGVPWLGVFWL